MELTLGNGIRTNIRFIAEGHLDLSRKSDEILQAEKEKEFTLIRINSLENDIRRIKEKID